MAPSNISVLVTALALSGTALARPVEAAVETIDNSLAPAAVEAVEGVESQSTNNSNDGGVGRGGGVVGPRGRGVVGPRGGGVVGGRGGGIFGSRGGGVLSGRGGGVVGGRGGGVYGGRGGTVGRGRGGAVGRGRGGAVGGGGGRGSNNFDYFFDDPVNCPFALEVRQRGAVLGKSALSYDFVTLERNVVPTLYKLDGSGYVHPVANPAVPDAQWQQSPAPDQGDIRVTQPSLDLYQNTCRVNSITAEFTCTTVQLEGGSVGVPGQFYRPIDDTSAVILKLSSTAPIDSLIPVQLYAVHECPDRKESGLSLEFPLESPFEWP